VTDGLARDIILNKLAIVEKPDEINSSNSATFWGYLEQLINSSPLVIDRPKNSTHPNYPDIVYPLDYGYLEGTIAMDGGGVDVWKGAAGTHTITGVLITVDLHKHDTEVKILLGCTETEMQMILDFQNSRSMRALLVHRT
jgi:inorganic pyrophosphatase